MCETQGDRQKLNENPCDTEFANLSQLEKIKSFELRK